MNKKIKAPIDVKIAVGAVGFIFVCCFMVLNPFVGKLLDYDKPDFNNSWDSFNWDLGNLALQFMFAAPFAAMFIMIIKSVDLIWSWVYHSWRFVKSLVAKIPNKLWG